MTDNFSLIIHGGAGALEQIKREGNEAEFMESIRRILESGRHILATGGSALDTVEHCAALLEDDPLYNAGRGSVLNEYGEVEMDAAIMDGNTFQAGAAAGITSIGKGAYEFAKFCGLPRMTNDYFVIDTRVRQWREAQKAGGMMLDHEAAKPSQKLGTIGAVAQDRAGNLAAATSTGGIVNKRWGRVGDSPIVGAGVFADNETCAVSATGYGEQFQRTVLCKMIADFIYFQNLDAQAAAIAGIDYLVKKVQGLGGVIVIDRNGRCAVGHSTSGMIYGWIEHGGDSLCKLA